MNTLKYMYKVNYHENDQPLWEIESRTLFGSTPGEKVFFSEVLVDPSISPFLHNRMEVLFKGDTFESLLDHVEKDQSVVSDFLIKYVKQSSGDPYAKDRNSLCKQVGAFFKEYPNFDNPTNLFGLTCHEGLWYFGNLVKNDVSWRDHNKRPHTYSNSMGNHMAKVVISLAGQNDTSKTIIDPCCGAGTVLLEGCFAGYTMYGSDMNYKMYMSAKKNVAYFGYKAVVKHESVQEATGHYDSAIVDLPYGHYSKTTPELQQSIIHHARRLADRVVVIASTDIGQLIDNEGLEVLDYVEVKKRVNKRFTRFIWVCK